MLISSWNVNSVRARIENIKSYLLKYKPNIVAQSEQLVMCKYLILKNINTTARIDAHSSCDEHASIVQAL